MSSIAKVTPIAGGWDSWKGPTPRSYDTFMKQSSKKIEGDLGKISKQTNASLGGQKVGGLSAFTSSKGFNIGSDILNAVDSFMPQNGGAESAAVKGMAKSALNYIPGVGQIAGAADSLFGIISGAAGKTLSGTTTGDKVISAIPVVGNIASLFSSKLDDKNFDLSKVSSEYSTNKEQDADKLGGQNVLFGANRLKNKINNAWNLYNKKVDITEEGQRRLNNNVSDLYNSQNLFKYSGSTGSLSLAGKKGMKFPELEKARELISSWSTKSQNPQDPQKFQVGGKIQEKNIIPIGELHKNLHHLEEVDPDLKGQITKKGIPVITQSEGGVVQHAEIERDEVVFRKEFTEELESLFESYKETPTDEIAITAGKLICYELLKNTDDKSGLIKSIK